MQNVKCSGEGASANQSAADLFPADLLTIIKAEGYSAKQVFSTNNMNLLLEAGATKYGLSKEEREDPGFKVPFQLFCSNAVGNFKWKQLLTYKYVN
jgi:hypothetical protein